MKKLKLPVILIALMIMYACGGGGSEQKSEQQSEQQTQKKDVPESIKQGKGIGEVKEVELTVELDEQMIKRGREIYEMKCSSCHKLTDQRVVGPGFAGVTNRRKPEWIMNMITNVDVMLVEDPEAQKLLEECLTRMPNQNVKMEDARAILEFFRNNDMDKTGKKDQAI
ncbi:cytochrome c [Marivirga sp. S37H4]|uniref:Cytochrome c n=1 Tax=Marivirga aurantiaca TaxID=2802615 RepID=A0A934WXX9_9BACT|nr:c-type cytochrome [Marivirga aurantiaca]MBK6264947.1 cytochrome c [Marivirga aurantiaca]